MEFYVGFIFQWLSALDSLYTALGTILYRDTFSKYFVRYSGDRFGQKNCKKVLDPFFLPKTANTLLRIVTESQYRHPLEYVAAPILTMRLLQTLAAYSSSDLVTPDSLVSQPARTVLEMCSPGQDWP